VAGTPPTNFVRVAGGEFAVACTTFHPVGANLWEMVELAAGAQTWGFSTPASTPGPALLRRILDDAADAGFNTLRALAHGVNKESRLQTAPGVYDEKTFAALDYAIQQASTRGLRLILALTSNWGDVGSVDEYVAWAGAGGHAAFFTDARARSLYLAHAAAIINRVNTLTGVRYGDDPTIAAWNLINEPRATGSRPGTVAAWVDAVAPAVKALAPKQLLTVGAEGFYASTDAGAEANPGGWAANEGQAFVRDHASPAIDFASIHVW